MSEKARTFTKAERLIVQLDQEAMRLEQAACALRRLGKLLAEEPDMAYPIEVAGKHLRPGWWDKL